MDKSDLNGNQVKLDYQQLLALAESAVRAHHLLMEDYRRRTEDALYELYKAKAKGNSSDTLHYTISAKSNAEYLEEQARFYTGAVSMLHYLLNAVNRKDVDVVNTPYQRKMKDLQIEVSEKFGEMINNANGDQAVYICSNGYFKGGNANTTHDKPFYMTSSEIEDSGGIVTCEFCGEECLRVG